jgi:hypothetical protein
MPKTPPVSKTRYHPYVEDGYTEFVKKNLSYDKMTEAQNKIAEDCAKTILQFIYPKDNKNQLEKAICFPVVGKAIYRYFEHKLCEQEVQVKKKLQKLDLNRLEQHFDICKKHKDDDSAILDIVLSDNIVYKYTKIPKSVILAVVLYYDCIESKNTTSYVDLNEIITSNDVWLTVDATTQEKTENLEWKNILQALDLQPEDEWKDLTNISQNDENLITYEITKTENGYGINTEQMPTSTRENELRKLVEELYTIKNNTKIDIDNPNLKLLLEYVLATLQLARREARQPKTLLNCM